MNSAAPWTVHVDPAVRRQLRRFPSKDSQRIVLAITNLAANPYSGDITKMRGEDDVWRRRMGAYRIFYEVIARQRVVHVFRVARRTSTTY